MSELNTLENEKPTPEKSIGWSKKAVSLTGMTLFSLGMLLGFFGGWFIGRMQSGQSLVPTPIETPEPGILIPYGSPSPIIIGPTEPSDIPIVPPDDSGVACTLEAKQCPDGSYVGRQPPSCQFAPCPDSVGVSGDTGSDASVSSPAMGMPASTTAPQTR